MHTILTKKYVSYIITIATSGLYNKLLQHTCCLFDRSRTIADLSAPPVATNPPSFDNAMHVIPAGFVYKKHSSQYQYNHTNHIYGPGLLMRHAYWPTQELEPSTLWSVVAKSLSSLHPPIACFVVRPSGMARFLRCLLNSFHLVVNFDITSSGRD